MFPDMTPQGRKCVHATRKKGNLYAARLALNRKKGALHGSTVVLSTPRPGRRAMSNLDPDSVALMQNRGNFWKSGVPARVMFYEDGMWKNFASQTLEEVKQAFSDGRPAIIVDSDGNGERYVLDFFRMLQVDLNTEVERSIAWIDVHEKCFFPKTFFDSSRGADSGVVKLKLEIDIDKLISEPKDGVESEAQSETKVADGGDIEGTGENKAEESPAREGDGGPEGGMVEGSGESGAGDGVTGEGSGARGKPPVECEAMKVIEDDVSLKRSGENEVAKADGKEGNDGSGSSQNSGASRERVARLPDLNKDEGAEGQLEHLAETWKTVHIWTAGSSLGKKVRVREVRPAIDAVMSEAHGGNDINEANRVSSKRTRENFPNTGDHKVPGESSNIEKRTRISSERETRIKVEKPKFDSMGTVLAKLPDDNKAYIAVKNLFLGGMVESHSRAAVKAIYWCSHASPMGAARLQAFNQNADIIKETRGSSNVKYAWYGAPPKIIESIVLHGFGQLGAGNGESLYGIGVHLSPEGQSYEGASRSEPDEDNVFHAVLCRVIMGNMEQIKPGSLQYHPKDESYDSGVDDLENPKWYIVWSTQMNTHILPEYVVSFTIPEQLRDAWRRKLERHSAAISGTNAPSSDTKAVSRLNAPSNGTRTQAVSPSNAPSNVAQAPLSDSSIEAASGITNLRSPTVNAQAQRQKSDPLLGVSSNMSFAALFAAMRREVPQSKMETLEKLHSEFKAGKFSKEFLVKLLRLIAGDKPLIAAFHSIRGQV